MANLGTTVMPPHRLHDLRSRFPFRRRSVRLHLTLVYSSLFLVSGMGLLALTYVLAATEFPVANRASNSISGPAGPGVPGVFRSAQAAAAAAVAQSLRQRSAALHNLLVISLIALGIMTVISIGLGWIVAGRMLRPLRIVTSTARRISASNLDERLAMTGPDDELKELSDTFDALLGRLERAFAAQRQFVANASHELRTPLARQRTFIEVALDDEDRTVHSLEQACERVLAAGQQQEGLISALLTLAQSQRGLILRKPIDLGGAVREALQARQSEAEGQRLRVGIRLQPAPALGDVALAERLAGNLVGNAIIHNIPGGWIEISTGVTDGRAVLSVANSGVMIPSAELHRLFEPFHRLGGDRASGRSGFGLGLSIVKAIAEAHDAELSVAALPSGGLSVQVRFPAIPQGLPADPEPIAATEVPQTFRTGIH
jgi:signal transduction histidine kinase